MSKLKNITWHFVQKIMFEEGLFGIFIPIGDRDIEIR